jgi:hypothetical protein
MRLALPKWDRMRLMAFVLTPQGFSTSSLVFGLVIIHPRKYYTPRLSKVKDILPQSHKEKAWCLSDFVATFKFLT